MLKIKTPIFTDVIADEIFKDEDIVFKGLFNGAARRKPKIIIPEIISERERVFEVITTDRAIQLIQKFHVPTNGEMLVKVQSPQSYTRGFILGDYRVDPEPFEFSRINVGLYRRNIINIVYIIHALELMRSLWEPNEEIGSIDNLMDYLPYLIKSRFPWNAPHLTFIKSDSGTRMDIMYEGAPIWRLIYSAIDEPPQEFPISLRIRHGYDSGGIRAIRAIEDFIILTVLTLKALKTGERFLPMVWTDVPSEYKHNDLHIPSEITDEDEDDDGVAAAYSAYSNLVKETGVRQKGLADYLKDDPTLSQKFTYEEMKGKFSEDH